MSDEHLPVNYCRKCFLVHPPMIDCVEAQASNMLALLARLGQQDQCRGCNKPIFWLYHRNGKRAPYTEAGLNHFIDCPQREEFQRRKT